MLTDITALLIISGLILSACLALLAKISPEILRRMLGYDLIVDVFAFIAMKWMFFGTASGMLMAFVGGLLFSIVLILAKLVIGYEKLERRKCHHCNSSSLQWVRHPARLAFARRSSVI